MLKDVFINLLLRYTPDTAHINILWEEIQNHYSEKGRHYHNITHLENLYSELEQCKPEITDWDCILFSLFYHDIVYNTSSKKNEEKSAELAVKRLAEINFDKGRTALCQTHIMATKSHTVSDNNDTNLFTDADLSILGKPWDVYNNYFKQVRKEYALYPDYTSQGEKKY